MPMYKVLVRRFVEEVSTIEIEADDPAGAAIAAEDEVRDGHHPDSEWQPGDDIRDEESYGVYAAEDASLASNLIE